MEPVTVEIPLLLFSLVLSLSPTLDFCVLPFHFISFISFSDTFQSNGACRTTCAKYALGIIQGKTCWCSNVAPSKGSQSDTSDCDSSCPGYPADSCGSASKGVFAYLSIIGNDVTSTAGGSTSTTSSTSTTTSTSESTSVQPTTVTVTASGSSISTSPTSTSSDDKTTTTSSSVSLETNSGGQVKTITVAATSETAGADSASANTGPVGNKLSGGSIAGIVIGVLGGIALVGALIFLIFFYRKRARSASPIPSQDMTEDRTSRGSSFMGGFFPRGNGEGGAGGPIPARSGTTFTDRRMKTNTVLYPNGARDSSVSLQDNEDYSRPVLRLTNPD
ncbi:unnamed protein product [Penicillium nalgiovense]|nr:unnamed protein product [Penicillium nalgiovense]